MKKKTSTNDSFVCSKCGNELDTSKICKGRFDIKCKKCKSESHFKLYRCFGERRLMEELKQELKDNKKKK
jgi:DNA-directed RNA polymerase subunit RPC12/RpoP